MNGQDEDPLHGQPSSEQASAQPPALADTAADALREALCPYCRAPLPKMPKRKSKCKSCGRDIYVKASPGNQQKVLMTEAQAEAAEREWELERQFGTLTREAARLNILGDLVKKTFQACGRDIDRTAHALFAKRALEGDQDAAYLMTSYGKPETRRNFYRLYAARRLKELKELGFQACQLSANPANVCPICWELRGKNFSTDVSALEICPADCSCETPGRLWIEPFGERYFQHFVIDIPTSPEPLEVVEDVSERSAPEKHIPKRQAAPQQTQISEWKLAFRLYRDRLVSGLKNLARGVLMVLGAITLLAVVVNWLAR